MTAAASPKQLLKSVDTITVCYGNIIFKFFWTMRRKIRDVGIFDCCSQGFSIKKVKNNEILV